MRLVATSEQDELRTAVQRSLRTPPAVNAVRAALDSEDPTYDERSWQRSCDQLGIAGLLAPECVGGAGAGLSEATIAIAEYAAALSGAPLLSTTIAIDALAAIADARVGDLRTALLAGTARVGVALADSSSALTGEGETVSGELSYVLDGPGARAVLALTEGSLAIIDSDSPGISIATAPGLDLTLRTACVRLTNVPALMIPLSTGDLERLRHRRNILLAADSLGLMRAMLSIVTEYAGTRVAFGRKIGSFQGVKHQLAELFCTVELAQAVVMAAAAESDGHGEEECELALLATRYVLPAGVDVTTECLRLMGGIGYTWEHDAHLYVRRAHSNLALGGPQGAVLDSLAARLNLS